MLRFADSFEHYGTLTSNMLLGWWASLAVAGGDTITLSSTFARTGTKSLKFTDNIGVNANCDARFTLGVSAITAGFGASVYLTSLPVANATVGMQFRDSTNTSILTLLFQSDGSIEARKGSSTGTVIDISDSILTAGTFHHVECKAVFDTVAGSVEVRVNGITVIQIGSLNLGSAPAVACSLRMLDANVSNPDVYWDDVFAWDDTGTHNNDFIGPQRILTIFPTGDTAQADFTKNGAATGYGCVNQSTPDGDTTYLSSTVVGHKTDLSLPTLPPELVTIAGVIVPAMARLDAAGVGNLKMSMKSAAALLAGADVPLTTGYNYIRGNIL